MPHLAARYETADITVTFTAYEPPSLSDEMPSGPENIEVQDVTLFGLDITRADVSDELWARIEALAQRVEWEVT